MLRLGRHRLRTPAICGSLAGEDAKAMADAAERAVEQGADLIELRLDLMREPEGWQELLGAQVPIILTNRPRGEGGSFKGDEDERAKPLLEGINLGADCVDIELSTPRRLARRIVSKAKREGATVLMSYHNPEMTPPLSELMRIARRMSGAGCDIAKLVAFAKGPGDALRMLEFLVKARAELSTPVVAFAMGDLGRASRIVAPLLGSPIVYAAVDGRTAPGQLDVSTARLLLEKLGLA